ncbi:MaoC family dehydratase [Mesonia sp. K7]|uniref:MaoC family dehydratase n=1 Tax=Mesonia sp. K7 TaxID=2218606 RepID=UPI000DAAAAB5|nr:MaoC family dehydratase [Mesonia sp. K7]PZD76608.1 enoyl-CoA hydratase [Mesonia sp. K7]
MKNTLFKVGDVITESKIFTLQDVQLFAELTGDFNPIHFDENYARKTIFKRPLVHGPLVITLLTTLFAKKMPGPGSVYLGHEVKYLNPVYHNDKIIGKLKLIEITEKGHYIIETTCEKENGDIVINGLARLKKF